jgi:hypothetical protein
VQPIFSSNDFYDPTRFANIQCPSLGLSPPNRLCTDMRDKGLKVREENVIGKGKDA